MTQPKDEIEKALEMAVADYGQFLRFVTNSTLSDKKDRASAKASVDRATKALALYRERHTWRPIAEAPKDARIMLGAFLADNKTFHWSIGRYVDEKWGFRSDGSFSSGFTHFMPLPQPPAVESE